MNSSFDTAGLQFAWDSTSLATWLDCERKYQLTMIENWVPRSRSVHLRFGGHYATALETYHKRRALGEDHETALRNVVETTLVASWSHDRDSEGNRISGTGTAEEFTDNAKTRENLIRTIIWYLEHYKEDTMTTFIKADGIPAVEYSFSLPVDNDIILAGHIDRLVNYAEGIYIQDQKTTGSTISAHYFKQFSPHTQMSLYTFAGRIIYSAPVKGVIIDAAQIAVGFSRFERGITMRTPEQLTEWYEGAMLHIQAARKATKENHFPMRPSSCSNYGGCMFRDVCALSPTVRPNALAADFEKRVWDPLQRR